MFTSLADEEGGKEVGFLFFLPKEAVENSSECCKLNSSSGAGWKRRNGECGHGAAWEELCPASPCSQTVPGTGDGAECVCLGVPSQVAVSCLQLSWHSLAECCSLAGGELPAPALT